MKVVYDAVAVTRSNARFIENTLGRQEMRTFYASTARGRARPFTYDNALELAYTWASVRAGIKLSTAVAYANTFRDLAKHGQLREFFAFADGDPAKTIASDETSLSEWQKKFPDAVSFGLIPLQRIKDHVDSYFDKHGVERSDG